MRKPTRSLCSLFLILTLGASFAAGVSKETTRPELNYLQQTLARLLAATGVKQEGMKRFSAWPPQLRIEHSEDPNAAATEEDCKPVIIATTGLHQQILKGNVDAAAFVLGHEVSHLVLGHVVCEGEKKRPVVERLSFSRAQEFAADLNGMKLALAAGYSKKGLIAYERIDEITGSGSLESLSSDHPSTKERLARLDEQNAALWRSMSAFDNGTYFLLTEHYELAENAFERVSREFPQSYEAMANLGYARLMAYADQLSAKDVEQLHLNAIVAGAFFLRPDSLRVRGRDPNLWNKALEALEQADRLHPDSPLTIANIGLAYLVKPDGPDAARAVKELTRALQLASNDKSVNEVSETAIRINLAVAENAAGEADKSQAILEGLDRKLPELTLKGVDGLVLPAYLYNRGMMLLAAPQQQEQTRKTALRMIETYLSAATPASAWWPVAFDRYKSLAQQVGYSAKAKDEFLARAASFRQVLSVPLTDGRTIELAMPASEVEAMIGTGDETVVSPGLSKVAYPKLGIKLVEDDNVVAIVLDDSQSPPIKLQQRGFGATSVRIHQGMKISEFDAALKVPEASRFVYGTLFSSDPRCRFYPDLGLAIRVTDDDTIGEMMVLQVPRSE